MTKFFGALAAALMLMTAQAASATTTFAFSFSGTNVSFGAFSASGLLLSDDSLTEDGATAYLINGASGEVDLGSAGKRTIKALATVDDGEGGETVNGLIERSGVVQAFQLLFTFEDSDDIALFTLNELANTAAFLVDGDATSGDFEYEVTAVPEPATWAMLMLGFAVVGAALRRRSARVARHA